MNAQLYRAIAWNVIQMRQGKGLRQEDLAEKIGLSRYQVSRIERGLGDITLDSLIKVADFFDVKYDKVFSESPKLRFISLFPWKTRRLLIQKNHIYDLFVVEGEILFSRPGFFENLVEKQIISIKGKGFIELEASSRCKRSRVLVVQSFNDFKQPN